MFSKKLSLQKKSNKLTQTSDLWICQLFRARSIFMNHTKIGIIPYIEAR